MGIGDSIGKAAENAMEDLAGTSEPADDAHAPEPGASDDDIQVHSSISEGSNAGDNRDAFRTSEGGEPAGTTRHAEPGGTGATERGATGEPDSLEEPGGSGGPGVSGAQAGTGAPGTPGDVPGPAGLPDPDPDGLRADPSEGDQDPSTGLGRG